MVILTWSGSQPPCRRAAGPPASPAPPPFRPRRPSSSAAS